MSREKKSLLLLGGAGYIGPAITENFLSAGHEVRVYDRLIYDNQVCAAAFMGHPNYDFIYGDSSDMTAFENALDGVTDVILLAGLVGDPITKKFPKEAQHINVTAYERILRTLCGRGLDKVVFVSTCSNYGLIENDKLASEDHELAPLSSYATAKVETEKAFLNPDNGIDFCSVVLRFATAFGLSPRMRFDLTVSEFARELYMGHELVVYDPDTWRPYCHVRDFARVLGLALDAPKQSVNLEVFNAGGEINNYTKRMIVDAIRNRISTGEIVFQEQGSDPRNYRVDFSKIRRVLGFEPSFTIDDGVAELVAAMDQSIFRNIETPRRFFGNYEIDYSLPD